MHEPDVLLGGQIRHQQYLQPYSYKGATCVYISFIKCCHCVVFEQTRVGINVECYQILSSMHMQIWTHAENESPRISTLAKGHTIVEVNGHDLVGSPQGHGWEGKHWCQDDIQARLSPLVPYCVTEILHTNNQAGLHC